MLASFMVVLSSDLIYNRTMLCHISKKISFTEFSLVPQVDVFSLHSQILQIPRLLSVLFDANPFKSNVEVVVFS